MNIGYIYKIINNINGKVYIEQTSKTIEERWKRHIYDSKREDRKKFSIQYAISKYGEENFSIEEIEKCDISELNEREIFWIAYYDSFHNGYNSTLGGDGGKILELDEDKVVKKYQELKSINATANYFKCHHQSILKVLNKHNVKLLDWKETKKPNINKVYLYDKNNNLLETFDGRGDVGRWLINNKLTSNKNPYNAGDIIRQKFRRAESFELFGYVWKIERNFDIENYKFFTSEKSKKKYYESKTNICPICGKYINFNAILCNSCENQKRKQEAINQRFESYGMTRETLKQEIRNTSFVQLGKKYNVSDKTISKWCKSYNLPYRSSEIKKYSDEEWEKL